MPDLLPGAADQGLAEEPLVLQAAYVEFPPLTFTDNDPATTVYAAPGHHEGLRMLTMGRGSYLLDYEEPMAETLKLFPDLTVESSPLMKSRLTYVVSRKTPQAAEVIRRLDSAYAKKLDAGFVLDPPQ
ncbi:hypothetical protein [Allohahella marinimesophila]|uniref:Uncharacterized protein n=1 Tax=Allohahella marinimesophila TaxID=1054972 RepID=A0ABP7NYU0_9GAMM